MKQDAPTSDRALTPLSGKRIWVTAERRVENQRRYLEERGAEVVAAPLLRTIDSTACGECSTVANQLVAHPPDILIAQTGQGLEWWTDRLDPEERKQFLDALAGVKVWTRGAKATSRCRSLGMTIDWQSPSESATEIAARCLSLPPGTRVAVQLVGAVNDIVLDALKAVDADVIPMRVYRYAFPADPAQCHQLITETIEGKIDAITFTASPAIQHLRALAKSTDQLVLLTHTLNTHCRPVVVGPVCAATAVDAGWRNVVEPSKARLMPMLAALTKAIGSDVSDVSPV